MLGYFKPIMSELSDEDKEVYKSLYCSVCYSMKERYGRKSTLLLQHDLLFLLLCTDISFSPSCRDCTVHKRKCIAFPLKKVNTLDYSNHSYEILGDLSIFTIYTAYMNKVVDKKGSIRNAVFSKFYMRELKKSAARLNVNEKALHRLKEMLEDEKRQDILPEQIIEPICLFYAELIGRNFRSNASKIAYHMCKIMYYLDALEDYNNDLKKGNFNILTYVYISPEQICNYVNRKVFQSLLIIQNLTNNSNNQEIIHNIINKSIISKLNLIERQHLEINARGV